MKDRLVVTEDHYMYRIVWMIAEDDFGEGAMLGQGPEHKWKEERLESCKGNKDMEWEHVMATITAGKSPGVEHDAQGYYWESSSAATKALTMIRAQLKDKSKKPWPSWALEAKAAKWTPPKGWTP